MKKKMRNAILAAVFSGSLLVTLSGCSMFGGNGDNNSGSETTQDTTASEVAVETEEEAADHEDQSAEQATEAAKIEGLEFDHEVPVEKAAYLSIDAYKDGFYVIKSHRGKDFQQLLVVPEGKNAPEGLSEDILVVQQPVTSSKIDSISVAELLCEINDGLADKLTLVTLKKDKIFIDKIAENMDKGITKFAGKAASPDMDLIKETAPQVYICHPGLKKEEAYKTIQEAGFDPFISYFSQEGDVLGRIEWAKALGVIYGDMESAERFYNEQKALIEGIDTSKAQGKSYIMCCLKKKDNKAFVRRTGDVIAKIGELAGGVNKLADIPKGGWEEMSIDDYLSKYKDTDYIIYLDNHGDPVKSIEDMKGISEAIGEFKAVKDNNVWLTKTDFAQDNKVGDMVKELNGIFADDSDAVNNAKEYIRLN